MVMTHKLNESIFIYTQCWGQEQIWEGPESRVVCPELELDCDRVSILNQIFLVKLHTCVWLKISLIL